MTRTAAERTFSIARNLVYFFVPGGLVFTAAFACDIRGWLDPWLPMVDSYGSYLVLGIGFLLGWRFHRSRLAFVILILMLADRMLHYFGPGGVIATESARSVLQAAAVLLPVNIALFYFVRERGILNVQGLLRLLFILVQPLAVFFLLREHPALFAYLERDYIRLPLLTGLPVSQVVLFIYLVNLLIFLFCAAASRKPIIRGFFWALLAVAAGLNSAAHGAGTTLYFSTAGIIIILAVIETAYAMAYYDELTGLPGRRALNTTLQSLGRQYVIAMLDIDFFKKFNDRYGHDVGDQVLCMVASHIGRVGGGGKPFRYGGEEFTVVFPGKTKEEVLPFLERLRQSVAGAEFGLRGRLRPRKPPKKRKKRKNPRTVSVTISIGVSEPGRSASRPAQVIKAADQALYRAKKKGRNCVVVA
jgi:diguanylate cyclase (GGDEF)-like protein